MIMKRSHLTLLAALPALLLLNGCVGYQLGSMLPKDIQTVYVPTFMNATSEPFLETETTRATIQEIQRDGSLKIAAEAEADSVLYIRLTSYELTPLVYEQSNRSRPSQYRAITYADVVLQRRSTGEVIAKKNNLRGDTTFDFSGDLTTAKRNALPQVAEDLAHVIVELVVETWN